MKAFMLHRNRRKWLEMKLRWKIRITQPNQRLVKVRFNGNDARACGKIDLRLGPEIKLNRPVDGVYITRNHHFVMSDDLSAIQQTKIIAD
jgi:hypothetical protein